MKIVIAPDSYKDCASAKQICEYIETGFKEIFPYASYQKIMMADGGEGTIEAMITQLGGERVLCNVYDPLNRLIDSYYGLSSDKQTAFIEMAMASGLELLKSNERNPLYTSSYGTGQLICDAINKGVRHIIIGIGGSATCDAGIGMAAALGIKFLDINNNELIPIASSLKQIAAIDYSQMINIPQGLTIEVACDVDNPLYGVNGASYIYNAQKGASGEMIKELDSSLEEFANKFDLDNLAKIPGAGAAGGLGFGLKLFLDAKLRPGAEIIMDYLEIESVIKDADLVITGEGRTDNQSIMGKAPISIAKLAKENQVDVIMLSASYGNTYKSIYEHGITASFSPINDIISLDQAIADIEDNLTSTARNVAQVIKLGMKLKEK